MQYLLNIPVTIFKNAKIIGCTMNFTSTLLVLGQHLHIATMYIPGHRQCQTNLVE